MKPDKTSIKNVIILLINTIFILATITIINQKENISTDTIMEANEYVKEEINGFHCYTKEVSNIHDNAHSLRYIQYVSQTQAEEEKSFNYQIGIRVVCNDTEESYTIFDKTIDEEKKHCDKCHKYLGNDLVKEFNEKRDIKLHDIEVNVGSVFLVQTLLGMGSIVYAVVILIYIIVSTLYTIKKSPDFKNILTLRFNSIFKSFTILLYIILLMGAYIFSMYILVFIILVSIPTLYFILK